MEIKYSVKINHAQNIGEFIIPNSRYKADGYAENINTIFEFHGDFWHGNPEVFHPYKINKVAKKTFGNLYKATLKKENIFSLGAGSMTSVQFICQKSLHPTVHQSHPQN